MSAEVVRYVLENTRRNVVTGMRQILRSGQELELILFLIDEGGAVNMTAWTSKTHPADERATITLLCQDSRAVAALFVAEFDGLTIPGDFRVAAVHWCYPEDEVSESSFFILDPDNSDLAEDHTESVDIPERLTDWLDLALEEARVNR